jgi:hypothetical protein
MNVCSGSLPLCLTLSAPAVVGQRHSPFVRNWSAPVTDLPPHVQKLPASAVERAPPSALQAICLRLL